MHMRYIYRTLRSSAIVGPCPPAVPQPNMMHDVHPLSCTRYLLTCRLIQRHRLHAFGEFERCQAGHPGFRNTDNPHNLLASGVRASFRAWI